MFTYFISRVRFDSAGKSEQRDTLAEARAVFAAWCAEYPAETYSVSIHRYPLRANKTIVRGKCTYFDHRKRAPTTEQSSAVG